eukprot:Skav213077  [mRNA]  locus=scaffold3042:119351:127224:+ [translate_table: standard]
MEEAFSAAGAARNGEEKESQDTCHSSVDMVCERLPLPVVTETQFVAASDAICEAPSAKSPLGRSVVPDQMISETLFGQCWVHEKWSIQEIDFENGFDSINITKLDVLTGLKQLRIAIAYRNSRMTEVRLPCGYFPSHLEDLKEVVCEYETLEGWTEDISQLLGCCVTLVV